MTEKFDENMILNEFHIHKCDKHVYSKHINVGYVEKKDIMQMNVLRIYKIS